MKLSGNLLNIALTLGLFITLGGSFSPSLSFAANNVNADKIIDRSLTMIEDHLEQRSPIPTNLLKKSTCVAVFPEVIKMGLVGSVKFGRGFSMCRTDSGQWSNPLFMTYSGGGFGLQAGIEKISLLLVFVEKSARTLLESGHVQLGFDATAAIGPFGKNLEVGTTDFPFDAEVYSYSQSKGLFLGVSMGGAHLSVSTKLNEDFYKMPVSYPTVLDGIHYPETFEVRQIKRLFRNYR